MSYDSDMAVAFAMYCDDNKLSLQEGIDLAERVGEAIAGAADDRRAYLPAELLTEEE